MSSSKISFERLEKSPESNTALRKVTNGLLTLANKTSSLDQFLGLKALIQPGCFAGAIPWLAFVVTIFMDHKNCGNNGQPRGDTYKVC